MKAKPHEVVRTVPRYVWLANIVLDAIKSGMLRGNDALPPERELAEKYEVSRDTVRKALRFMQENGAIYSDHGRGNFVQPEVVRGMTRSIDSFSEDTQKRGGVPGQRFLKIETVAASMAIAGMLNVSSGTPLMRVHRIRLVNDQPVGLQDAYFVVPKGAALTQSEIERTGSIYKLLKERFSFYPAEAVENLSATAANAEDAGLLNIKEGSPMLLCERITFSERREAIEYCVMKYVQSYHYSTRVSHTGTPT